MPLSCRDTMKTLVTLTLAGRVDVRFAEDNDGELYLLTKGDGMIRQAVGFK